MPGDAIPSGRSVTSRPPDVTELSTQRGAVGPAVFGTLAITRTVEGVTPEIENVPDGSMSTGAFVAKFWPCVAGKSETVRRVRSVGGGREVPSNTKRPVTVIAGSSRNVTCL